MAPTRSYLIHAFEANSTVEALKSLQEAHDFLVCRASKVRAAAPYWGCIAKRSGGVVGGDVDLRSRAGDLAPSLVGKFVEAFCEVVNMTATVQRLIDTLTWIMSQERFTGCSVCSDPTTSDFYSDLLLLGNDQLPIARFEAADKDAGKQSIKTKIAHGIIKLNAAVTRDRTRGAQPSKFLVGSHEMRERIKSFSISVWEVGHSNYPTVIGELSE